MEHDTHAKALSLNLDPSIYGTLAEIGAGQEVARWFLRVGGASGTVAKTISAYDKMVSDDIYGAGTRYVSKERLLAMLDSEYKHLLDRLKPARGQDTRFFVLADHCRSSQLSGHQRAARMARHSLPNRARLPAQPDAPAHKPSRFNGPVAAGGDRNSGRESRVRRVSPEIG
jgi:hypothetical protein